MNEYPPCPGCGAQTVVRGSVGSQWLETYHVRDCPWLLDPESEPYDEFDDE